MTMKTAYIVGAAVLGYVLWQRGHQQAAATATAAQSVNQDPLGFVTAGLWAQLGGQNIGANAQPGYATLLSWLQPPQPANALPTTANA